MTNFCGTYSGYTIHIRDKIEPCEPCRAASRDYQRLRRQSLVKKLGYDPRRFKRHGITKETYDELLSKYDGKCWICKDSPGTQIDHDHKCCNKTHSCGKCVSGILCLTCNTAIGLLRDDKEILKAGIEYLESYK